MLPKGNVTVAEACWDCCESAARSKERGLLCPMLYYVYTPSEASIDEALIKGGLGPKLGDKMGSIGIISTNRNL